MRKVSIVNEILVRVAEGPDDDIRNTTHWEQEFNADEAIEYVRLLNDNPDIHPRNLLLTWLQFHFKPFEVVSLFVTDDGELLCVLDTSGLIVRSFYWSVRPAF